MTIRKLSKYFNIKNEIIQLEEEIKELEFSTIGSTKINELPSVHNCSSPTERIAMKFIKLKDKLQKKKERLIDEQKKIETFLDSIDDSGVRIIARKRFLEGKSWELIGKEIYTDRSTPYYRLKRYLKKCNTKTNEKEDIC